MPLTVLSVAYPLAPVGPDAPGGAEQVLSAIDRALTREGAHSIVVACQGSCVAGTLVATPPVPDRIDPGDRAQVHEQYRAAIRAVLRQWPVDVVHMHGLDFDRYLPPAGPPVIATLHLPPSWYSEAALHPIRPDTHLVCVSASQRRRVPAGVAVLEQVNNGVDVERLAGSRLRTRAFAAALGRVCPEKGFHLALAAAQLANVPLVVAGPVFPYDTHRRYFDDQIAPRLDRQRRYIGQIGFTRKRRLLSAARCLIVSSLAEETSSLVTMEALACGTPVVAFPSGALSELIDDGRTGVFVESVEEMARAMQAASRLDSAACREAACRQFDARRMTARYLDVYRTLIACRWLSKVAIS
ncbi:MAG TPA: glycosyltransferase [Vicinamibacterales bacterium]|nr:glycosyltransferase [Vicinamibacterales bacterium]